VREYVALPSAVLLLLLGLVCTELRAWQLWWANEGLAQQRYTSQTRETISSLTGRQSSQGVPQTDYEYELPEISENETAQWITTGLQGHIKY
jgi:hypothetical protein